MSVTLLHIVQIIDLTWNFSEDKIVTKRMNKLLGRKDGLNAHQFRLFVKDGDEYVALQDSSIAGKMFFRKPDGKEIEIAGVAGTETVDIIKFTLPYTVYEQGVFRIDIRLEKASAERTIMVIEGNVL